MRSPSALPRSQTGSSATRPAPRTSTARSFAARGTRRPRRRPSTRPTRDWVTLLRSSARPSTATRSTTPGCRCEGWSISATRYPNAFWDGRRMVFGDGDGEIFKRLHARSLTSSAMSWRTASPRTRPASSTSVSPGALNESMSDVFGSLVEQHKRGQTTAEADWLIGEDVWTPGIQGDALRSMKAPGEAYDDPLVGKDPQPAHMSEVRRDESRTTAAFTSTRASPTTPSIRSRRRSAGAPGRRRGAIWYAALRDPGLGTQSSFQRFAGITVRVAQQLYGAASSEALAVYGGWEKVGVPAPKP